MFETTGKITLKSRNTVFTKVITETFNISEVFMAQGITTLDFTVKNQQVGIRQPIKIDHIAVGNDLE